MKKIIKQMLLLFATVFVVQEGMSQEDPVAFSLDEAVQYAMQHSYVLHNTGQDITIAQKKVWETITTGLPQVSGSFDYSKNIKAAKTPFPVAIIPKTYWDYLGIPADTPADGVYPVSFTQKYSSKFGIKVSQQLFNGSWIVGIGSAKLYLDLAKQTHEKSEIDIRDAVSQAYYMILVSQQNVKVMKENLANTTRLYEETKAYVENGFREQQDADQLRIMQKNAANTVAQAKRELSVAQTVLKYAMGYDLDSEITLKEELEKFVLPLTKEKETVSANLTNHIDYRIAQSDILVNQKLLKLEKAAYLPTLNAFYDYSKSSYGDKANLFKEDWYPSSVIGLKASIPIFNSGKKRAKMQQARLKLDKANTNRKLAELTLRKDYLTALADMENVREQYLNTYENRDLAKSILDKTQIKFKNGMVNSVELSQQESQYITTWQQLIQSTLQLLQSDLKLKKAAGVL